MTTLHAKLLAWFDVEQRDLPWRRTKDPYAIWVSEIMLQQTQVATVIPYFERWMARFPTVSSLASASEDEVLTLWQGLGYYRRAKQLLTGAKALQSRNRGIEESTALIPTSATEWQKVAGIGPYTAGAIASIAFNQAVPLVDGNVERVYARLNNDDSSGNNLKRAAWDWAADNIHPLRPGDWNQALMELGATICKPVDPQCPICPVAQQCLALQVGRQNLLPTMVKKPKPLSLTHHVWIPVFDGVVGIRQIPDGQWWGGMWEFPRSADIADLEQLFPNAWPEAAGSFRHTVTNHRIQVHVSKVAVSEMTDELRWIEIESINEVALPAPQRRAFNLVARL